MGDLHKFDGARSMLHSRAGLLGCSRGQAPRLGAVRSSWVHPDHRHLHEAGRADATPPRLLDASRCCRRRGAASPSADPRPAQALIAARDRHAEAKTTRRKARSHVPLRQVRPSARRLDEETKLITHAIRMSAYNAQSTLARMLAGTTPAPIKRPAP
jgi:hypothetical protein